MSKLRVFRVFWRDRPLFLGWPKDKYTSRSLILTISVHKIHHKCHFSAFLAEISAETVFLKIGFSRKILLFWRICRYSCAQLGTLVIDLLSGMISYYFRASNSPKTSCFRHFWRNISLKIILKIDFFNKEPDVLAGILLFLWYPANKYTIRG